MSIKITGFRARPVAAPLKYPPRPASGAIDKAALVLIDIETDQGITGCTYLFTFAEISLDEKDTLLKEIHHRVKNNFQIITSLLNLQSQHLKDEHDMSLYKDTQNRIRAMALVHEKLYQSENISEIDYEEYKLLSPDFYQLDDEDEFLESVNMDIYFYKDVYARDTSAKDIFKFYNIIIKNIL